MITFEKAKDIIRQSIQPIGSERIPLNHALNRILAENVIAETDMPPFNKSAMDGYACRKEDLSGELHIIEVIPAGKWPENDIGPGKCARIMTGSVVPDGADFILMQEHAESAGVHMIKMTKGSENNNICYKGEDVRKGDILISNGSRILPAHIASMASTGNLKPEVYTLPKIGILLTGNELVEPEITPGKGKIRSSNGYQLSAQTVQCGLSPEYLGIVADDKDALFRILKKSIERYDVLLISGGVSVGDFDYIPEVLSSLGVKTLFHGLHVKPGKHFLLGEKNRHYVAGMPGNPVSSFVIFEMLIKTILNRLSGLSSEQYDFLVPIDTDYDRKKSDVLVFIPVLLTHGGTVVPLEYHGSAHINAYTLAHGIMQVPIGINHIEKGSLVHVRPL